MKKKIWIFLAAVCLLCLHVQTPVYARDEEILADIEDGNYAIEVTLEGGSGKASVTSPCDLTVVDGKGYARLTWSSSYYDYMIVEGEKYFPVNEEGNSVFEIPITLYDSPMAVIADTTAMGTPHEIDYTLTFYSDKIMGANETPQARARYSVYIAIGIVILCMAVSRVQKMRRNRKMRELAEKRKRSV